MFRLVRIFRYANEGRAEDVDGMSKTAVRLAKMLAWAFTAAHWLGLAWYWLSEEEGFSGDGIVADDVSAALTASG